ncbi:hypothetical protein ACA910_001562 [Epithemia clementina (nom. ined.)]
MHDQARFCGLAFLESAPQWKDVGTEGWCCPEELPQLSNGHATVVVSHPEEDHQKKDADTTACPTLVAVIGGWIYSSNSSSNNIEQQGDRRTNNKIFDDNEPHQEASNSVHLLDPYKKQCHKGPSLNVARVNLVAVSCSGGVFVIGGEMRRGRNMRISLDLIERIDIATLLAASSRSSDSTSSYRSSKVVNKSVVAGIGNSNEAYKKNQEHDGCWETLKCRLSSPRSGCAAAAVQDRYIVVMGGSILGGLGGGGYGPPIQGLSTVEIIDTAQIHNGSCCAIVSGPNMNSARSFFGATSIGSRVFAAGGIDETFTALNTVESLRFYGGSDDSDGGAAAPSFLFPNTPIITRSKSTRTMSSRTISTRTISTETTSTPQSRAFSAVSSSPSMFSSSSSSSLRSLSTSSLIPHASSWKVCKRLRLKHGREGHTVSSVGSCLIVAGGEDADYAELSTVEVIDTHRGVTWNLPNMSQPRSRGCMVALSHSNSLLALGGNPISTAPSKNIMNNKGMYMETLSIVDLSSFSGIRGQIKELKRKKEIVQQKLVADPSTVAPSLTCSDKHVSPVAAAQEKKEQEEPLQKFQDKTTAQKEHVQGIWNTLVFYHLTRKQGFASRLFQTNDCWCHQVLPAAQETTAMKQRTYLNDAVPSHHSQNHVKVSLSISGGSCFGEPDSGDNQELLLLDD